MELSTYFRINAANTGQFERTLIVAEEGAYVSYLEGCTAPMRDENQLHAAVVELVALKGAEIKYSTVQKLVSGRRRRARWRLQLRHSAAGAPRAKISWTQVETGSAITWKVTVQVRSPSTRRATGARIVGNSDRRLLPVR